MGDLIERLRDKAARFHRMHWKRDYEDISEAADEIERLRHEIERLRHEIDVQYSSEYVERILKENERLRAALERIANEYLYEPEGDAAMFQRWAREALDEEAG
jgi:predicted RNase H-like nuclease (RuvC/YqgF family)